MIKLVKKMILWGTFLSLLFIAIVGIQLFRFNNNEVNPPANQHTFVIKSGNHIKLVAQQLSLQRVIEDPWLFILLARLKGLETRIRAGEYHIEAGQPPTDLLAMFVKGNSIQYRFTVIEGWTFSQMLASLEKAPAIEKTLHEKSVKEIMQLLGLPGQHPEGLFFPDTYLFPRGTTDLDFLKRAYRLMRTKLHREWDKRESGLPLKDSYEALILASIIEKETGVGFERPLIASVFIQRLKRNMRLQTDPTVIYGLGGIFRTEIFDLAISAK